MTLSYNVGLTAGSLMSYILDDMLGPPVPNGCTIIPAIIKASSGVSKFNATVAPNEASIIGRILPTTSTVSSTVAMVAATVMTAATAATSTMSTAAVQATSTASTSTGSNLFMWQTFPPNANATLVKPSWA